MHLAILFPLLLGSCSFVAAAPSAQHAQITVELTNMDDAPQNHQVDVLHSSQELPVTTNQEEDHYHKSLPFKFILRATNASGPIPTPPHARLPFGFRDLNVDGFPRGELGFTTVFELRDGKLITGDNRGLGYHPAFIQPPWTSLWSLKTGEGPTFDLVAFSILAGGRIRHFLQFEKQGELFFGAFGIKHEEPVFVGNSYQAYGHDRLLLAIEQVGPLRESSDDDINEDFDEELL